MKKGTLIFTVVFLLAGAGSASAFTVKLSPDGSPAHWPVPASAIFYVVNPAGPGSDPAVLSALDEAFQSWRRSSGGNLAFVFSGQRDEARAERDGVNTLLWVNREWEYGSDVVAMSTVWYADRRGTIEEADIEFNARDYRWSLDGRNGSLRLPEIAIHEIGHLLGVDHSFNPGSVMHDSVSPGRPVKTAFSRDDVEAVSFLYPSSVPSGALYDLPVLFYPQDFPGEAPARPLPGLEPSDRELVAVGSLDADGDGIRAEVACAFRNKSGKFLLELRAPAPDGEGGLLALAPGRELPMEGEVIAVAGGDFDRDGGSRELAVLERSGGRETLRVYSWPASPGEEPRLLFSRQLQAPSANNVVGMTGLDFNRDGVRDEIAVLRATGQGFVVVVYSSLSGGEAPLIGERLLLPGLQKGSQLLGLMALDADGDGEERDLVVLERIPQGKCWLHAFRPDGSGLAYLASAPAPEVKGAVFPARAAAVDFNRDGLLDEAIVISGK
ncbi:MAG: matrixin family metalloprotease [Candidatus Aureabacteria bacterium]|nr:matrixin family metalloprotease [Candidatus Auribacterota bacterium]